jgi:hypothetical protein
MTVASFCTVTPGCTTTDILDRLGVEWSELFVDDSDSRLGTPEAIYPYVDAGGSLLFEVIRFPGKRFLQRRPAPDAPGGYTWNRDGVESVLYRLPAVLTAAASGEVVYVVEGRRTSRPWSRLALRRPAIPGVRGSGATSIPRRCVVRG